jgi:hypothetical protein
MRGHNWFRGAGNPGNGSMVAPAACSRKPLLIGVKCSGFAAMSLNAEATFCAQL